MKFLILVLDDLLVITKKALQIQIDALKIEIQKVKDKKDELKRFCAWLEKYKDIIPPKVYNYLKNKIMKMLDDLEVICDSLAHTLHVDTCILKAICLQIDINEKEEQLPQLNAKVNSIRTAVLYKG